MGLQKESLVSSRNADDAGDATDGLLMKVILVVSDVIETARAEKEDPSKGYINFLFFGDIMEAACEVMNPQMNSAVSNSAVMIGPVVINHPRGKRLLINAADIPISYADFQTFFFETVVRKQLASYPLKQFLKDVLERLVKKTLQSECFEKGREKEQ